MFVSEKQFKALESQLETLMVSITAASEEKEGDDYEALKARVDELESKLKAMTDDPKKEESEESKAEKAEAESAKAEDESKKEEARTQAIAMAAAKAAVAMLASVGHDPVNTDGKGNQPQTSSEMSRQDWSALTPQKQKAFFDAGGTLKD